MDLWSWKYQEDESIFIPFDVVGLIKWKVICVRANTELLQTIMD